MGKKQNYKQKICGVYIDDFFGLSIHDVGHEYCNNGHSFGPYVRNRYLIHYVLNGNGKFDDGKKVYSLKKGMGFLICPEKVTSYKADEDTPWEYAWISFSGIKAEEVLKQLNLSEKEPIYVGENTENIQYAIMRLMSMLPKEKNKFCIAGAVFDVFGEMAKANNKNTETHRPDGALYVEKAINFIHENYHRKLKVSEICAEIGVDRTYLFRLFEKYGYTSPKKMMMKCKMERAAQYMKNRKLNLSQIACSVGFDNISDFSKAFKRVYGMAPREYRRQLQ